MLLAIATKDAIENEHNPSYDEIRESLELLFSALQNTLCNRLRYLTNDLVKYYSMDQVNSVNQNHQTVKADIAAESKLMSYLIYREGQEYLRQLHQWMADNYRRHEHANRTHH